MDFNQLMASIDHDTVHALRRAVELGKFPDGNRLTKEQRGLCLEAVLAWEAKHLPEEQRTGYIDRGPKKDGELCADTPDTTQLKWAEH